MGLLATLKVMLGVDSVEFQTKMRQSEERVSVFENNFGKRSSLVERHGLRLVRTAEGIGSSMQRMSVDAGGGLMQLAENVGFSRIALGIGGIAAVYGVLKAASDALMKSTMDAGKPVGEMAAALVENGVAMENVAAQVDMLAKRLGTSGEALGVNTAATMENAVGLLALRDALEKELKQRQLGSAAYKDYLAQQKIAVERTAEQKKLYTESVTWLNAVREAQARFNAVHGQLVPIGAQVAIALARGREELKSFADEARRSAGVMNAEELRAKTAALEKQIIAIAQSGGSASQTVAALGGQFEEAVKLAKELGVQLTPQFERAAEAIAKGPGEAMDDLFASFRGLPKEVEASRTASAAALAKMGTDLEGSISGGFGRGAQEGVNFAKQQMDAWRTEIEATPIKLKFDASDLQRIIDAVNSGRIPTTTGSAP